MGSHTKAEQWEGNGTFLGGVLCSIVNHVDYNKLLVVKNTHQKKITIQQIWLL